MRTIRFLLFILLSFNMTCAWADILPIPGGKRHPGPRGQSWEEKNLLKHPPDQKVPESKIAEGPQTVASEARVSMAAANVQVRIKKMDVAPGAGETLSRLLADVTGEFDMVCAAVPKENKDIEIAFPIGYEDERPTAPVRFVVTIDGKPAADLKTAAWSVTDENNRPRTQWGYAWRLTGLRAGQKTRIVVQYSMVLPQKEGKANFIYFLRSGARWDGPIGQEIVNVTADKGLRLEVLSPTLLKPEKRSDTSLTWRITNAKPAEDIRLIIVPAAKP
jgi:hypothetical protein